MVFLSCCSAQRHYAGVVITETGSLLSLSSIQAGVSAGLFPPWLDPAVILGNPGLGPWVVLIMCVMIFAETGLLIGFFLPGDSLLFTAGLLIATGTIEFNIGLLILLLTLCAFLGNQLGCLIGASAGPALYSRPDSRLFRRKHVQSAHAFFEKHGGRALILARFVPIVRTFIPVVVGVAGMNPKRFAWFNALGALLWTGGIALLGYFLGDRVPFVRDNLDVIFIAIVAVSVVPLLIGLVKGFTTNSPPPPGDI